MLDVYTLLLFLFFYHLSYLLRGFCGHSYVFIIVFVILFCELHVSYFFIAGPQPGLGCKTHHTVKTPCLLHQNTIIWSSQ